MVPSVSQVSVLRSPSSLPEDFRLQPELEQAFSS